MKVYRIVVRGGYGFTNFGDDALMFTLHQKLTQLAPESEIAYLCKKNKYLSKIIGQSDIISFEKLKNNAFYAELLVYGGGTQFYSFTGLSKFQKLKQKINSPTDFIGVIKAKLRLYKKNNFIDNKFTVTKYANKVAVLGVGLGPFEAENKIIENKTKQLFKELDFIAVRDLYAKQRCKDWGVTTCKLIPDICFALESSLFEIANKRTEPKRIGVIVRDWKHNDSGRGYYENLKQEANNLRAEGFIVTFISFDRTSDKEWMTILKEANEDYLMWDPAKHEINEFLGLLNEFDLFITARYHGAIFSSLLNKPFIAIEVEQKLAMISEVFENGAHCWEKPFKKDDLLNLVSRIRKNYQNYVQEVMKKKNSLVIESDQMFRDFNNFYNGLN